MIAFTPRRFVTLLGCGFALLSATLIYQHHSARNSLPATSAAVFFEPNLGQAAPDFDFVGRTRTQTTLLSATRAVLRRGSAAVSVSLEGARPGPGEGVRPGVGHSNYFLGNRPSEWKTNVGHFAGIRYRSIYPGIDLVYYGNEQQLEYDFVVAPGADPAQIRLRYGGAGTLRKNADGELSFETTGGKFVQRRPSVYQRIGGEKVEVPASYRVSDGGNVEFALARFDRTRELVIDPAIDFSVYYGGAGYESATSVALDSAGNLYVTGVTSSTNLPMAGTPLQSNNAGASDVFVAKFSNSGALIWSTYLGGKQSEAGNGIAVDSGGNVYVSGFTTSMDFPVANAFQPDYGGGGEDAFVLKISPNGDRLLYSTYLGGGSDDYGNGIAVDSQGSAYLTGWTRSTNPGPGTFPIVNAAQTTAGGGGADAFVAKFSPAGNALVYSTYIGGNGQDLGTGIAVDSTGAAYVTGTTSSASFPTVNAFRPSNSGNPFATYDAFVTKVSPAGNTFVYSTFLGGANNDQGNRIAVDASGSAYVTGYTMSPDFPTLNAAQPVYGGNTDVFVTKFAADGHTLIYSTYIGGSGEDQGFGNIALDASGSAYVTGWTSSAQDFPIRNPAQRTYGGGTFDAFVTRIAPAGNAFLYSTFLGGKDEDKGYGIAVDLQRNNVYVVGQTASSDMPAAHGTYTPGAGQFDVFVSRLSADTNVAFGVVTPDSLTFNVGLGSTTPVSQTIAFSSSASALNFAAFGEPITGAGWISVSPASGVSPATITVTVDPSRLNAGTSTGRVTLNIPGASNAPVVIPVTVNATAVPQITALSPDTVTAGSPDTALTIRGSGFSATSVVLLNGVQTSTQFVDANTLRTTLPRDLLLNIGTVRINVSNPGSAPSRDFNLNIVGAGPFFTAANVVNAATQLAGPVAPGEIVTILGSGFGPSSLTMAGLDANGLLSTSVAGTRVLFDNTPAPIVNAQNGQVSAVVPYQVTGQTTTVVVEYNGQRSSPVTLVTVPVNPGIFTQDFSGKGSGAITNQDSRLNTPSNPAAKGSVISIFATGEGQTNPSGVTGAIATDATAPRPVLPVSVRIAGVDAPVSYAGAVPGNVAGLLQVNVTVPASVPSGQLPVILTIGGTSSRSDVTVSVQ